MSLVTVEVFLKFELYLQLNLDLHLGSTKLGLGLGIVLGLDLARGQTGGAPKFLTLIFDLNLCHLVMSSFFLKNLNVQRL